MKFITVLFVAISFIGKSQPGVSKPEEVIRQLKFENDPKTKARLILEVANFDADHLSHSEYKYLTKTLLNWYRDDPSSYVHSAIDHLFRHSRTGETPRKINWNLSSELDELDQELVAAHANNTREWFLTSEHHTMTIISGPVTFVMGSPVSETYRSDDELQHQVTIPRSFAISTKEVSVAQFQKFLEENPLIKKAASLDSAKNPSVDNKKVLLFSPEDDCPQIFVTWYEAAQYCNWLSKQDGIPETEWCYPAEMIKSGMIISKDYLKRSGYRLPTEAEWEYAARANTTGSRFYGSSDELLPEYAWYSRNPPQRKGDPNDPNDPQHTYPAGQLKPNMFGLFDVYGNVWEWCDSRRLPYSVTDTIDECMSDILIADSVAMVRRGGSFSYGKDVMRSAHRGATKYFPNQRRDNVGFRIARTID